MLTPFPVSGPFRSIWTTVRVACKEMIIARKDVISRSGLRAVSVSCAVF